MTKKLSLKDKANCIRGNVIDVSVRNKAGHIAPSLSCVDILAALYYKVMNYRKTNPFWEGRDRLVFSKAHGCYGLYAILAQIGVIPKTEWENFYTNDSTLLGCMERRLEYGLEAGCGSLGHGIPIAIGLAYGAKMQKKKYHTFCVAGDGELQEGSTWEALQFAVKHNIGNVTIVIDANRLQAMDFIVNILDRETKDILNRLRGFGLNPVVCTGHDADILARHLCKAKASTGSRPNIIIAETIKGFGLRCMENAAKFHFRIPTDEDMAMGKSYASSKSNIKNKREK